jgi:hypothetical protein
MRRPLQVFLSALALLALPALPGCADEVIVTDPDAPNDGFVSVSQSPPNQAFLGASFYKRVPAAGTITEVDHDGACRRDHFALPTSSSPRLPVDAGEVRVTGGLKDFGANFESGYDFHATGAIFKAGDVLNLDVGGSDDVAPMSVTLSAPPVVVIAPPPATIDIGKDLTFTWTSSPGAGTLTIQIEVLWDAVKTDYSSAVNFPREIVGCTADISQGTLTIPASLLSQLPTMSSVPAIVSARASNFDSRHAGNSRVGFSVNADAATPSGALYMINAKLN